MHQVNKENRCCGWHITGGPREHRYFKCWSPFTVDCVYTRMNPDSDLAAGVPKTNMQMSKAILPTRLDVY